MPSILKNDEQETALKEISESLATIKNLNKVLDPEWAGNASINFVSGRGRNSVTKINYEPGDKEIQKLIRLAEGLRDKLAKEIQFKAEKNRIALDKDDLETLKGSAPKEDSQDDENELPAAPAAADVSEPNAEEHEPPTFGEPAANTPDENDDDDIKEEDLASMLNS